MEYVCNIYRSPHDYRDYEYLGDIMTVSPDILDYRKDLQPIRDQGGQGTCYAQSVACVKEWQEKKDYGFNNHFSPQFFYNNRKNDSAGMYSRDVMKLMKQVGICFEESYPYGKIENRNKISKKIYEEAKNHIIKGYARIYKIFILKESLYKNGPCLITFPVYNYGPEFWIKQNNNIDMIGGHAVTIIGYNETGFIIRNSWGTNWANNGYSIYKYIDWGKHWEIWTTIDDKSNYLEFTEHKQKCCTIL